ncbi:MAG: SpoIIE family protein phosphatase, partial [Rhodoferax sp.]|nr:SpoIIE family protein phosphatase [Rhodoferax sp.]
PQWQREIRRALGLNAFWRSQLFHLPSAVQTRYLSQHNFVWAAPWKPAKLQAMATHAHDDPVWLQAQSAPNPDRVVFWGKPFFAGAEAGLAVPVAAPVYEGDALVGVISIDNSLDYLNRINGNFGYPLGEVYVVNDADQVLAHPRLYANPLHLSQAPGLQQALPAHWPGPQRPWQNTAARSLQWHDGHLLLYRPFISAPWHMVYQVPVWPLLRALLLQQGGGMLAVLGALVALLGVTYALTRRDFVGPAAQLVAHLGYVSQASQVAQTGGTPLPRAYTAPRVPAAWQPWFDTVEKVFSESRQLAGVQQELRIAAEMQRAILPSTWPISPHYTLCGVMRSAREVGGDFYDHFPLGAMQQGIVVADVSGKGVGAALFGMVSKTQWRAMALRGNSAASQPADTMTDVNNALADHNEQCMFVTGLYAVLDAAQGQLHIANAGHPPLVRLRRTTPPAAGDWQVSLISMDSSMALGLVPDAPIASQTLQLQTGDLYVLYTDGVTEAMNPAQEEFGNARLLHALDTALHSLPPDAPLASLAPRLQQALIAAVDEFAQGAEQSDDITCLVLHYHPKEAAC